MSDDAHDLRFDIERNLIRVGGSRVVFHCHHYNLFLQRTIDEALGDEAARVQRRAATEAARRLLWPLFAAETPFARVVAQSGELFAQLGFGRAVTDGLGVHGGDVVLQTSHYAVGWEAKWGRASGPVCHFAVGFWSAVLAVAAKQPAERILASEPECHAAGAPQCRLRYEVL